MWTKKETRYLNKSSKVLFTARRLRGMSIAAVAGPNREVDFLRLFFHPS